VVAPAIAWCTSNITPRYPNFRFQVADVYSGLFNPTGTTTGADYTIPFDDATFDVVCLLFVFSHMLPNAVERYLSEIARVLKPAGRSLATYVLLNPDSLALVEKTAGRRRDPHGNPGRALLGHDCGEYRLSNPRRPEALVAHREEFVLRLHERFGLEVDELGYGAWPGRDGESVTTHHDFIVAIKRPAG
jgi:SAM-dependent methyltransferase